MYCVGVVSVLVYTSLGAKVLLVNNNKYWCIGCVVVDDDFCVLCVCLVENCVYISVINVLVCCV